MSDELELFLERVEFPFVVVSTIPMKDREAVVEFLIRINAPVYLEGISGIREESRLRHLRVTNIDKLWEISRNFGYPIDGILRIGGVPTFRPWRDLEDKKSDIPVCSISHLPFSGLSRYGITQVDLTRFLMGQKGKESICQGRKWEEWIKADCACQEKLQSLIAEEPEAEPSLLHQLSNAIPNHSLVYLGNSLPIREWDLAASYDDKKLNVFASRGVNGIDGQVSTFFGMALPGKENWGIFGDLTMLYDLAAPWVLKQMKNVSLRIVVINNSGGKIFERMFPHPEFLNLHDHTMEYIAKHWRLAYCGGTKLPERLPGNGSCLIELFPDPKATDRFWKSCKAFEPDFTQPYREPQSAAKMTLSK